MEENKKFMKKIRSSIKSFMIIICALVLLFYITLPYYPVTAAGNIEVTLEMKVGGSSTKVITEEDIQKKEVSLELTLKDNEWKNETSRLNIVKDSISDPVIKNLIETVEVSNTDPGKLIVTLNTKSDYRITSNHQITMSLSPALIENWEGTVKPLSFMIYAQPRILLDGSIIEQTTTEDLRKGGKEIEIELVNATWIDEDALKTLGGLDIILDAFYVGNDKWKVAQYLKLVDPNTYVSIQNNNKLLKLKLPPIQNADNYNQLGGVEFKPDLDTNLETIDFNDLYLIDNVDDKQMGTSLIKSSDPLQFNIKGYALPSLTLSVESLTEEDILSTSPGNLIKLELQGDVKWNIDTKEKKQVLIDSLLAKNQPEQWEKVQDALRKNLSNISVSESYKTLEIKIPQVTEYYLTTDQDISIKVPYQLLDKTVTLVEQTFKITAKAKALISGSVFPSITHTDLVQGGKTVVITLVNATWKANVVSDASLRESLLSNFGWGSWDSTIDSILKARAQVVRTNDKVVTITLPPIGIDGFKLSSKLEVKYEMTLSDFTDKTGIKTIDAFTVTPIEDQSVSISGTILSNTNEFDIVKGGKTISLTLKNDRWIQDIMDEKTKIKISGLPLTEQDKLTRTSDTVVTIELAKRDSFNLPSDTSYEITIPKELLIVSSQDLGPNPAFQIKAVQAELSGTGLSLDPVDIQKGGKTIVIKLLNESFKDNVNVQDIVSNLSAIFSPEAGWNSVLKVLERSPQNIKVTKDTLTIKLPPVPNYASDSGGEINAKIPYSLIEGAPSSVGSLLATSKIVVGQIAKATMSQGKIIDKEIKTGNISFMIKLEGAKWDPTLATNKSKRSSLIKGFTTSDQTKEWSLISSAILSSDTAISINSTNDELTVTIPSVLGYSIIRDQEVSIKVPKSVLVDYKYDIQVEQTFTIDVPTVNADKTFSEVLQDNFVEYIEANGLENIRVIVPGKKVQTISFNTIDIDKNNSLTTVEVRTNEEVEKVKLTVKSPSGEEFTREETGSSHFIFVFSNLAKNSDLTISIYGKNGSDPLQPDIYKKIPKGSKVFNELPKKDFTGSYSLYNLLTDKSLLKDIFKYYTVDELKIGK